MTGQRFRRLAVIELDEERNEIELCRKLNKEIKQNRIYYICKCDCGNIVSVSSSNLKSEHVTSCGCYAKEQQSKIAMKYFKKYNSYDLSGEYGVGWLNETNNEFYFDLEDYDLIKDILWNTDEDGYARGYNVKSKKLVRMHKIITGTDFSIIIDHENRNKLDNRKDNFRYVTKRENRLNSKTRSNNSSGIQGVMFENGKWRVRITVDKKYLNLGMFNDFEQAVRVRLLAEKKYYGQYAMQKNLFNKYGVS